MTDRVRSWHALAALNARLFRNCFADVSDALAVSRPGDRANSMAFIAIHLVEARHFIAAQVGATGPRPFGDRFDSATSVADITEYPPVADIVQAWDQVSADLDQALAGLPEARLDEPATHSYTLPIADTTVNGSLAFMLQHESYHLGQLALLRKLLGIGAMTYA